MRPHRWYTASCILSCIYKFSANYFMYCNAVYCGTYSITKSFPILSSTKQYSSSRCECSYTKTSGKSPLSHATEHLLWPQIMYQLFAKWKEERGGFGEQNNIGTKEQFKTDGQMEATEKDMRRMKESMEGTKSYRTEAKWEAYKAWEQECRLSIAFEN